ncbi:peptidoglycan DD-metalloendopeptidase family protein [Blochmannia endosymbiont of Camponotus (Colobopsis) obliquus]|uniref:peptidoglycan DD-metalloendopeptidase family protein n=1 Tax=Blochmannia endosymbiont of Camponotus (Colobopsis) obliquus TaxID=1505597 RepID=UPI00061B4395|nr:peptidoglycan DD-metalloendopeptidase family protein [Blochmannia endosymbiont of Camponotus (Colobopsis) obliquus]
MIKVDNDITHPFYILCVDYLKYKHNYKKVFNEVYHHYYKIQNDDTLFYISWITKNDYLFVVKKNNTQEFNTLKLGNMLYVNSTNLKLINSLSCVYRVVHNFIYLNEWGRCFYSCFGKIIIKIKSYFIFSRSNNDAGIIYPVFKEIKSINVGDYYLVSYNIEQNNITHLMLSTATVSSWQWPTDGKIVDYFSSIEGGNKGIDISGSLGQPVLAAANGKVVYAGNALRGYGNLIIIQHNNDYLSAYAHNELILVNEHQKVKAGQKIATMGHTETNFVKLHFEIRYKGKSVNPLFYLP